MLGTGNVPKDDGCSIERTLMDYLFGLFGRHYCLFKNLSRACKGTEAGTGSVAGKKFESQIGEM